MYCYCSLSLGDRRPLRLKGIIYDVNKSRSLEASSLGLSPRLLFYVMFIACEKGSVLAMKRHSCTDSDTSSEQNHTAAMLTCFGAFYGWDAIKDPAVGCRCPVDGVTYWRASTCPGAGNLFSPMSSPMLDGSLPPGAAIRVGTQPWIAAHADSQPYLEVFLIRY